MINITDTDFGVLMDRYQRAHVKGADEPKTVAAMAVKLPAFWVENPELWFAQVECVFNNCQTVLSACQV